MKNKIPHIPDLPTYAFSGRRLSFGLWYIEHKIFLRKVFIAVIIFFDSVFLVFSLWRIIQFFVIDPDFFPRIHSSIARPMINYDAFYIKNRPSPLLPVDVVVLPAGKNMYDIVATVKNPNEKWHIPAFSYQFLFDGGVTEEKTAYVLPTQERYVAELAIESETTMKSAQFRVSQVQWSRIAHEGIRDYSAYRAPREKFFVSEALYTPARELDLGQAVSVSRSSFRVANESAYNFWNVSFVILLTQNNRMVAVNVLDSGPFLSDSAKNYESSWFGNLPSYLDVKVFAYVDILDPDQFMDFRGGAGPRK